MPRSYLPIQNTNQLFGYPVFLEWFVDDEETYTKAEVAKLCDAKMKTFSDFQVASSLVKRSMTRLQGVPGPLDLSQFTCDACRGKRDTVCVRCTDWSSIQSNQCWPKLNQMAEQLGTYIDAEAVKQGLLVGEQLDGSHTVGIADPSDQSSDPDASRYSTRDQGARDTRMDCLRPHIACKQKVAAFTSRCVPLKS